MSKIIFVFLLLLSAAYCRKIDHVFVLMMENRGFDHILGWLKSVDPTIEGCLPSMGRECANPKDPLNPNSEWLPVNTRANLQEYGPANTQSFEQTNKQIYSFGNSTANMQGFISACNGCEAALNCFTPDRVPALTTLAMEYAVMNRYYCSVPAQTFPNRMFLFSGTAHGFMKTNTSNIIIGGPQRSIFNQMDESKANVSWSVYSGDLPSPMYLQYPRLFVLEKFHPWDQFAPDVRAGKMTNFVFIDPRYEGDRPQAQEAPNNVGLGDRFIKEVYEAIRSSPLWEKSLLILTYDEHGGWYDHVPPPEDCPSPDGIPSVDSVPVFHYDRLGVRVPMILISPWIKKGLRIGEPESGRTHYEHSSLLSTVRRLFNMTDMPPLTKRDEWAAPYDFVVNSAEALRTDCITSLPFAPT